MGRTENLKPWQPGQSGNPGGWPKSKPLTDELKCLLSQEAPNAKGRTGASLIAEALLKKARKGDVRAIAELANRIEGKPRQAVELAGGVFDGFAVRVEKARKRVIEKTQERSGGTSELSHQINNADA